MATANSTNPRQTSISRLFGVLVVSVLCTGLPGCARLGARFEQAAPSPGTPEIRDILNDLAANDRTLASFQASGSFTLVSPERAGVDRFRQSTIVFRKPTDLYVVGRKLALPKPLFRLTCVGTQYLIEFPTEKEYYYQVEGERFESVPFSVSPSDVAREMFFPEPWAELPLRRVRMTSYDQAGQTATVEILEHGFPRSWVRRRLTVKGIPWIVVTSERFDKRGNPIAVVSRTSYRELDGIRFPAMVDAEFPGERTRMSFDMRTIRLNSDVDEAIFDIEAIRTRLESLGHRPVEYSETE